jgi:hypothetical protein
MARRIRKRQAGTEPSGLRPDWRPLLDLAPDEVPDFMWMFRDFLEGGIVVEAYKHRETRQYLHLDAGGRAYEFLGGLEDVHYEEVDPVALIEKALRNCEPRANIVRQNEWIDGDRIEWARSATRHRISRLQTLSAIQHAGVCFDADAGRQGDRRLYFFEYDEDERPLEIVAIEREARSLLVIHSMIVRDKFEEKFTEALRWRK